MFRNKYQKGPLSILYSCGKSPLELWDMHVRYFLNSLFIICNKE